MELGCRQAIADDSAFSLSMPAEFEPTLSQSPWRYKELLGAAGMIDQILYLEAEAIGLRGTGWHEMVGIEGKALQSIYHFRVGAPLEDTHLATLPLYPDR